MQLKIDREQEALRLKAQDEDEANGIAPGTAAVAVDKVKGGRVQLDLRSGREVTEVEWAALLDGSRVLKLLYRLEVTSNYLFNVTELVWFLELLITVATANRVCSGDLFRRVIAWILHF